MNTIKSFWIGWGSLCLAGGGAYYFAKKSINADRAARHEEDMKRRRRQEALEHASHAHVETPSNSTSRRTDGSTSPSGEATLDPAPTRHSSQQTEAQRATKYEAKEPFRSRKGDRFS